MTHFLTPQNVLCLIIGYLLCALSIVGWYLFVKYWPKIRLYCAEFLFKLGFIGGALVDIICQLWIDVIGIFRKKGKVIKLDEYEEKAFHRSRL